MALSKIQAESMNLADTYAFTGSVSGVDGKFESQLFHVVDQKSGDGGSFTQGDWRTRDLNTIRTNEITGASLSSNQITLPVGSYYIETHSTGFICGRHQTKWFNVTESADILKGSAENTTNGSGVAQTKSFISGRFNVNTSSKTFEIRHYCNDSRNTDGFGLSVTGENIYTDCKIWKVA